MLPITIEPIISSHNSSISLPLTMGTGSPIVKIINDKGIFVDRGFDSLLSPTEINDELQITLWASQHKIAPLVHAYDVNRIIMDWVDGTHIPEPSLDQIADLAVTFKNMHAIPAPKDISQPKQSHFVDKFLDMYFQMEKNTSIPSYLKDIKEKLIADVKETENLVLCHGDVHANNVLWTKDKLFLIDWTCAGLDYPIVDLAIASMFWNFDSVQGEHLLKFYLGHKPDERCLQKLDLFKKYAKVNWAMWPILKILADFPEQVRNLGEILETRFKTPTRRSFEEYRRSLFQGTFNTLVQEFDDWVDLHLARVQSAVWGSR